MPLFRTLLIILVIFIIYKAGKVLYRAHQRRNAMAEQRSEQNPEQTLPTTVVRCAICGVHVPKTEALAINGRYACSEAHARDLSDRN